MKKNQRKILQRIKELNNNKIKNKEIKNKRKMREKKNLKKLKGILKE